MHCRRPLRRRRPAGHRRRPTAGTGTGARGGARVAPRAETVYYANCAAARAAGAAPIYAGQPGYSSKLDRDNDGIACE
ncbi:hypothetical protein GS463_28750 [Rhodococcus hoagii]|nr:hypothetical protein [Prescottella equi]